MGEAGGGQDHGQRRGVTSGMQRCEHRRAILSTGMPKDKKQLFKQENICMKYLRHLATPGSCKKFFLSNAFHFFTFSNHKWIFHFAWHDMAANVRPCCCFLSFNSQVYTDSYCLSILTNAVMISELCNKHGQSNPSPRCRTAADQPKSHEVFMKSLPPVLLWPWICLTTKWFTKLNTMKVKTWIIIGPNNYTWHPSKLLVSGGHSFMRTRDVRQQDQEKKSDVRDYYSHSWTDGLRLKWTFLNLHLYIE